MSVTPTSSPRSPRRRTTASDFTALILLIAINVGVFVAELATAPFSDTLGGTLVQHGGLNGFEVDHGEWWRIVTSGFLHASGAHIFGNLVALVILGGVLTLSIGQVRMVWFAAAGLIGSAFSVLLFDPTTLTVGASGAIFGLAGGALVVGWRQRRIWLGLVGVVWTLYTLSSTVFVPGISQAGHFGGLIAGGLAGALLIDDGARLRSEVASA